MQVAAQPTPQMRRMLFHFLLISPAQVQLNCVCRMARVAHTYDGADRRDGVEAAVSALAGAAPGAATLAATALAATTLFTAAAARSTAAATATTAAVVEEARLRGGPGARYHHADLRRLRARLVWDYGRRKRRQEVLRLREPRTTAVLAVDGVREVPQRRRGLHEQGRDRCRPWLLPTVGREPPRRPLA